MVASQMKYGVRDQIEAAFSLQEQREQEEAETAMDVACNEKEASERAVTEYHTFDRLSGENTLQPSPHAQAKIRRAKRRERNLQDKY